MIRRKDIIMNKFRRSAVLVLATALAASSFACGKERGTTADDTTDSEQTTVPGGGLTQRPMSTGM